MSRLITLQDWAKEEFGDLAPSERVLKNTRKENDGPTRYKSWSLLDD